MANMSQLGILFWIHLCKNDHNRKSYILKELSNQLQLQNNRLDNARGMVFKLGNKILMGSFKS